jgi:hypothetical protein
MLRPFHPQHPASCTVIAWMSLALLGTACAGQAGTKAGPTASASVVRVTTNDNGRHLTMHIGEHLVLALGPTVAGQATPAPISPRWSLTAYPRELLKLTSSDAVTGRFEFLAVTTGTGALRAVGRTCGPPLPAQAYGGLPCPLAGGTGQAGSAPPIVPIRLFSLTVTIT